MYNFAGMVALVTGSSEGIGFATALRLAKNGATVIINGRDPAKLNDAYQKIKKETGSSLISMVAGDVTDAQVQQDLASVCENKYGRLDILVNNVGGGSNERFIENITSTDWNHTVEKNLSSSFFLIKSVIGLMKNRSFGRIVNVSSIAGRNKGRLSGPQYAASKAGMLGMTRHLAYDLAPFGITVNAVAPGIVSTERAMVKWETRSQLEKDTMMAGIPMGRFANPDEIAAAIEFLASPDASYLTGVSLDVNGGAFMS